MASKAFWKFTALVLLVLLNVSLYYNFYAKREYTPQEIGSFAEKFVGNNLLGPESGSIKVISVADHGYVYNVMLEIDGKSASTYVTKDGAYFFTSGIDVDKTEAVSEFNTIADVKVGDDPVLGNKDAKVTFIEFSDFECPFCVKFSLTTMPDIKKNYVDTGKIKVTFLNFPLENIHENSLDAAKASECAYKQGKFWEMHDMMFEKSPKLSLVDLRNYAEDIGLDLPKFDECMASSAVLEDIAKDVASASDAGVSGTPAFFINGRFVSGAQPYEVFQQIIEQELAKAA